MRYALAVFSGSRRIARLVLWTFAGLGIILWANHNPDDRLPIETHDDNFDGMR
jgi:hypothetical protein